MWPQESTECKITNTNFCFSSLSFFFLFLSGFIMSLLSTFPWKYLNNISIWCCGNFNICYYTYNIYMTIFFLSFLLSLLFIFDTGCEIYMQVWNSFFISLWESVYGQLQYDRYRCIRGHMRKSMLGVWQGCLIY